MNHFRHASPLNVAVEDEKIYLARVVDAYRGGSLGNPYLAEHQDAPRFMPEFAERLLALSARVAGLDPLLVARTSRVVFPVLIYVLCWRLARELGMQPRFAMLAAMLSPLSPAISWIGTTNVGTGFLRYFRAISPAFYVLAMMLALQLVFFVWRRPSAWAGLAAGAGLGVLFYITPIYYWSFTIGGSFCLVSCTAGRVRSSILISLVTAFAFALPSGVKNLQQVHMPDVRETLTRLDLLTPGRAPDIYVTRSLILAVLVLAAVGLWRHRLGECGRFLFPFISVGTLLMIQNMVTNRHLQGYHWIECLIPFWSLAAVAFLQNFTQGFRFDYLNAFIAVLISGAIFLQVIAYLRWEQSRKDDVEFWALDDRMPHTLNWLNQHTRANSVVIADSDIMDSLVMFTHNKVYWADYASQHVVPSWEVEARTRSVESWHPGSSATLPFRADLYLGTGSVCHNIEAKDLLYRDQSEDTCVLSISK
jgi:hypothetical protein